MITERMSEAAEAGAERLVEARGSIRAAFDSLETGITFDDLAAYVERDFHAKYIYEASTLDAAWGRIVGVAAGCAIVAVESDRAKRGDR